MKHASWFTTCFLLLFFLISCASSKIHEKSSPLTADVAHSGNSSLVELPNPTEAVDFSLENINGELVSLSDYRGKVVLLSFWATWCHSCKSEMDFLVKLRQQYHAQGFEVLSINVEAADMKGAAISIARSKKVIFPILFDVDGNVSSHYNPDLQLPYSVIIDRQGLERFILKGFVPTEEQHITSTIEKLLGK